MKSSLDQDKLIYLQITQGIEDDILKGFLEEGEQVISTTQLAKRYRINPATAAKGINILVGRGILFKKRGLGMFVKEGAREIIRRSRKQGFYREYILPMLREAEALGIPVDEVTGMIKNKEDVPDGTGGNM